MPAAATRVEKAIQTADHQLFSHPLHGTTGMGEGTNNRATADDRPHRRRRNTVHRYRSLQE